MSIEQSVDQAIAAFRGAALRDDGTHFRDWEEFPPLLVFGSTATLQLLALLQDAEESVRGAAASALAEWRRDQRIIEPLIGLLTDSSACVRCSAALSLGEAQDVRAVKPLAALLADAEADVRLQAAQALGRIGGQDGWKAASMALWDEDLSVRNWAARSLRDADAWAVLREAIDGGAEIEPEIVAETLGEAGGEGAFEYLVLLLRDGGDPNQREEFSHLVEEELGWSSKDIAFLSQILEENDLWSQREAALALGKLGDPRAADYLVRTLRHSHHMVRLGAAQALTSLGDRRGVEAVLAMLADPSPEMLRDVVAAATVGKLNDPRVDAELSRMLNCEHAEGRLFAERGLRHLAKPRKLTGMDLLKARDESEFRDESGSLLDALGQLPAAPAVEEVARLALESANAALRTACAWVLTQVPCPTAEEALEQVLRRHDVDAAEGAYAHFVGLGSREAEDLLLDVLAFLGHKGLAEDLSGCGNEVLAEAGRAWLELHPRASYMDWQPWGLPACPVWGRGASGT